MRLVAWLESLGTIHTSGSGDKNKLLDVLAEQCST